MTSLRVNGTEVHYAEAGVGGRCLTPRYHASGPPIATFSPDPYRPAAAGYVEVLPTE